MKETLLSSSAWTLFSLLCSALHGCFLTLRLTLCLLLIAISTAFKVARSHFRAAVQLLDSFGRMLERTWHVCIVGLGSSAHALRSHACTFHQAGSPLSSCMAIKTIWWGWRGFFRVPSPTHPGLMVTWERVFLAVTPCLWHSFPGEAHLTPSLCTFSLGGVWWQSYTDGLLIVLPDSMLLFSCFSKSFLSLLYPQIWFTVFLLLFLLWGGWVVRYFEKGCKDSEKVGWTFNK